MPSLIIISGERRPGGCIFLKFLGDSSSIHYVIFYRYRYTFLILCKVSKDTCSRMALFFWTWFFFHIECYPCPACLILNRASRIRILLLEISPDPSISPTMKGISYPLFPQNSSSLECPIYDHLCLLQYVLYSDSTAGSQRSILFIFYPAIGIYTGPL